jgi:hypothetical protein
LSAASSSSHPWHSLHLTTSLLLLLLLLLVILLLFIRHIPGVA